MPLENNFNIQELLEKYRPDSIDQNAGSDHFVNWLGLKTEASPFAARRDAISGKSFPGLPIPDDGVYGTSLEYATVLLAMEVRKYKSKFVGVELGAGWGPWVSAAAIIGIRKSMEKISLVAVEADHGKCQSIYRHFETNKLTPEHNVDLKVMEGAAWHTDDDLYFNIVDSETDHGAAATDQESTTDYRGFVGERVKVTGYSLPTICDGLEYVDMMHWDVQGAELAIVEKHINFLNKMAKTVLIGTHSIYIHGALIKIFYEAGWDLIGHNPPAFTYNRECPTLEGMTTTDGEILFVNPNIPGYKEKG